MLATVRNVGLGFGTALSLSLWFIVGDYLVHYLDASVGQVMFIGEFTTCFLLLLFILSSDSGKSRLFNSLKLLRTLFTYTSGKSIDSIDTDNINYHNLNKIGRYYVLLIIRSVVGSLSTIFLLLSMTCAVNQHASTVLSVANIYVLYQVLLLLYSILSSMICFNFKSQFTKLNMFVIIPLALLSIYLIIYQPSNLFFVFGFGSHYNDDNTINSDSKEELGDNNNSINNNNNNKYSLKNELYNEITPSSSVAYNDSIKFVLISSFFKCVCNTLIKMNNNRHSNDYYAEWYVVNVYVSAIGILVALFALVCDYFGLFFNYAVDDEMYEGHYHRSRPVWSLFDSEYDLIYSNVFLSNFIFALFGLLQFNALLFDLIIYQYFWAFSKRKYGDNTENNMKTGIQTNYAKIVTIGASIRVFFVCLFEYLLYEIELNFVNYFAMVLIVMVIHLHNYQAVLNQRPNSTVNNLNKSNRGRYTKVALQEDDI